MIPVYPFPCGEEECTDPLKDTAQQSRAILAVMSVVLEDINDLLRIQRETLEKIQQDAMRYVKFSLTKQSTLVNNVHSVLALETENAIAEQVVILATHFPGAGEILQEGFAEFLPGLPAKEETSGVSEVSAEIALTEDKATTVPAKASLVDTAQTVPTGATEEAGVSSSAPESFNRSEDRYEIARARPEVVEYLGRTIGTRADSTPDMPCVQQPSQPVPPATRVAAGQVASVCVTGIVQSAAPETDSFADSVQFPDAPVEPNPNVQEPELQLEPWEGKAYLIALEESLNQ